MFRHGGMAQKGYSDQTMPELVAKMRTTASRRMTNGRSHHFSHASKTGKTLEKQSTWVRQG
jgi:hypothetical protein